MVDTQPDMSVTITTPNHPQLYPDNANIEWKMSVEDTEGKTLLVTVNSFQVHRF